MERGLQTHTLLRLTVGVGQKADHVPQVCARMRSWDFCTVLHFPNFAPDCLSIHCCASRHCFATGQCSTHAAVLTQNFSATMSRHYHGLCYHSILTWLKFVLDHNKSKIRERNVNKVHKLRQDIIDEWNQLPVRYLHRPFWFKAKKVQIPKNVII